MDKYAPKFSKVLVIPDPHYIPGYAGYCPQLKYNVGKSYSRLTAELLTSPDVKHSNRLLLHTGRLPSPQSDGALTRRSLSDSNLKKMIPGYTGFIPKSQNYFACSYSEVCRKALSEFYQDGRHSNTRWRSTDLPAVAKNTSQQFEKPKLPLVAISDQVINYQPLKPFIPTGTPYSMDDNDPHKYFISGFTGHVPKSRFLIGKGYPITTNQALIQFAQQQRHDATSQDATGGKSRPKTPMPSVYPSTKRVLPSFTGHIPGYKFMYGHTFGQLSQKALEKSSNKRIAQTKSLSHQ